MCHLFTTCESFMVLYSILLFVDLCIFLFRWIAFMKPTSFERNDKIILNYVMMNMNNSMNSVFFFILPLWCFLYQKFLTVRLFKTEWTRKVQSNQFKKNYLLLIEYICVTECSCHEKLHIFIMYEV